MADEKTKQKSEKTDWLPLACWTLALGITQDDLKTLVPGYGTSAPNVSKTAAEDQKGIGPS